MRIGLVMEWIEPGRGGAETSTNQFIRHLLDMGMTLEVITRSRLPSRPGMQVHTIKPAGTTRAGRSDAFSREADRVSCGLNLDVLHAISPCLRADIYEPRGGTVVESIQRNLAIRQSQTSRSLKQLSNRFNLRQQLMLRLEKQLFTRDPKPFVVALSDYVIRQLVEHYSFPESHIRKIFNGVDADSAGAVEREKDRSDIRSLYGIADYDFLVLMVAHNFKLKGVARWIDALGILCKDRELPLRSLIIGKESPLRWQRRAAAAGVADRVQFVGATRRINGFYHAADLLVHPTYYDPCSRVVLEALVSGLPCITTRFDGSAEAVKDGQNGYVIDSPDQVEALADRVRRLSNPDVRRQFADRASLNTDRITMKRHAEELCSLYREIASRESAV